MNRLFLNFCNIGLDWVIIAFLIVFVIIAILYRILCFPVYMWICENERVSHPYYVLFVLFAGYIGKSIEIMHKIQ